MISYRPIPSRNRFASVTIRITLLGVKSTVDISTGLTH
jgi:hypothetical protein